MWRSVAKEDQEQGPGDTSTQDEACPAQWSSRSRQPGCTAVTKETGGGPSPVGALQLMATPAKG